MRLMKPFLPRREQLLFERELPSLSTSILHSAIETGAILSGEITRVSEDDLCHYLSINYMSAVKIN